MEEWVTGCSSLTRDTFTAGSNFHSSVDFFFTFNFFFPKKRGSGGLGQLGLGPNVKQSKEPQRIEGLSHITKISVGTFACAALAATPQSQDIGNKAHELYLWGNLFKFNEPKYTPSKAYEDVQLVQVLRKEGIDPNCLLQVKGVSVGKSHVIVMTESLRVFTFGCNQNFVLGVPGDSAKCTEIDFKKVFSKSKSDKSILTSIRPIKVAANEMSSAILTLHGKIVYWGYEGEK